MTLPNFLIIGVIKGGTTSLYSYMRQHPEVYMPEIKETRFFAYDPTDPYHNKKKWRLFPIRTEAEYRKLFNKVVSEKAIGEVSPQYLESEYAARRIKKMIPDAKLIASLRNPVDRTYSHFQMAVRIGQEKRSLDEAFKNITSEDPRWVRGIPYYENVKRYIDLFGKEKLKIVLFEDLRNDALAVAQSLYKFLDVDPEYEPDTSVIYNVGGMPKNALFQKMFVFQHKRIKRRIVKILPNSIRSLYEKMKLSNLKKAEPMPEEIRERLYKYFRDEIIKLQDLIEVDLSSWMK